MRGAGVVLGLCLLGCRPDRSEPASARIGPDGGVLQAVASDGATLTLDVPPGAFTTSIEISLVPLEPGDDVALFQLDPPGLVATTPISLTFTHAGLAEDVGFLWEDAQGRAPLGGSLSGDTLALELSMLGFRSGSSSQARDAAPPPAAGEGRVAVAPLDCTTALASVPEAYQKVLATGDADAVGRFLSAVQTMRERCQEQETRERIVTLCTDYTTALEAARVASVSDDAALQLAIGPLLAAHSGTQMSGGVCDTAGFEPVLIAKIGEHLTALRARYAATSISDSLETHLDHLD